MRGTLGRSLADRDIPLRHGAEGRSRSQGTNRHSGVKHVVFPDQSHIDHVRHALWSPSHNAASVMVGSGLTRHALRPHPGTPEPPLWFDLATQIAGALYPSNKPTGQLATSDIERLAQEYEITFGRTALHDLLSRSISDNRLFPSQIHRQLLGLPWRDVFTTNWDTLLERTRSDIPGQPYGLVDGIADIPLASQPRIVKLHGSFPATFPLIVTEEDYRTYPSDFAPFVNMVQQAMMETVFCLIGFSGNDPNFLHWSGWVRDNLGDAAPRIYLAGWLDIPQQRRRMLEDRGIVPIDLARHPEAADWPEPLRHRYATEWVLYTLEGGRPYEATEWPSLSKHSKIDVPAYLPPIEGNVSGEPREEKTLHSTSDEDSLEQRVKETLEVWSYNRENYPGWLMLPSGQERQVVKMRTDEWESPILEVLGKLPEEDRLKGIRELVWRRETLLEPHSEAVVTAAETLLDQINCQERRIGATSAPHVDWGAIREAWRTVALALVTTARFRLEWEAVERWLDALGPFSNDDPDVGHRMQHERCLSAVWAMDFRELEANLDKWRVDDCDPAWAIRKGALLWESGRGQDATTLVRAGIEAIRAAGPPETKIPSASREGWALWSVWAVENRQLVEKRWSELASLKCDGGAERDFILKDVSGGRQAEDGPAFNLGSRTNVVRLGFGPRTNGPYRAVRASEVAGLPSFTRDKSLVSLSVGAELLKTAADKLATIQPELAIRLVLRVCEDDSDNTLMRVVSRTRVATLDQQAVDRLAKTCAEVIKHGLVRVSGGGHRASALFWGTRLCVAMEVLSRLVLRATPDDAEATLDLGLECYQSRAVLGDFRLGRPLGSLLQRSWEALPKERRAARTLDLLSAPIVGMDAFATANPSLFPDPGAVLQSKDFSLERTDQDSSRWREAVAFLARALRVSGEPRMRASARVGSLGFWQNLTDDESSTLAEALWDDGHTAPDQMPSGTSFLNDSAFLVMPEPSPGLAEESFRRRWLGANAAAPGDSRSAGELLWQVGDAIARLQALGRPMAMSDEEEENLLTVITEWSQAVQTEPPPLMFGSVDMPAQIVRGISAIISTISVPESVADVLYARVKAMTDGGGVGFEVIAGLVRALPEKHEDLMSWLKVGLSSEESYSVIGALVGLYTWLKVANDPTSDLREPSSELVREVGFMIASRRKVALAQALQFAQGIFDEESFVHQETIGQLAIQGLDYLTEELDYDRARDPDEDVDVPLLRCRSVQLAQAMSQRGFGDHPVVTRWLEIGASDPLPEVRYTAAPNGAEPPE